MAKEIDQAVAEMDGKRLEDYKTAFQFGFDHLSKPGMLSPLIKHANEDLVEALTVYIVDVIGRIIKKYGIIDAEVLMYVGTTLLSDAADRLVAKGVKIVPEDLEPVIHNAVQQVLTQFPEVAKDASANPNLAKVIPPEAKVGEQPQQEQQLLDQMPPELAQEVNPNGGQL